MRPVEKKRNKICIRKSFRSPRLLCVFLAPLCFSSIFLSPPLLSHCHRLSFVSSPRGRRRLVCIRRNDGARHPVNGWRKVHWTEPRPRLPHRRPCFVSRRLVCPPRAIEPAQKLRRCYPVWSTPWNLFPRYHSSLSSFSILVSSLSWYLDLS